MLEQFGRKYIEGAQLARRIGLRKGLPIGIEDVLIVIGDQDSNALVRVWGNHHQPPCAAGSNT